MSDPPRSTLGKGVAEPLGEARRRRRHAAIVSNSPETRDGLETYLQDAGIPTRCTSNLSELAEVAREASTVVVFPDDYPWDVVAATLRRHLGASGHAFVILVTASPKRCESLNLPRDAAEPLIVPKPAWGWTILDAIREQPS